MTARPDASPSDQDASANRPAGAPWRKGDAVAIPGDYQYRALTEGFIVQRFWHSRKLTLIEKVAPPEPGTRALDVGCGSGVVANFLAERGAVVDAVDSNEQAIEFARERFPRDTLRFHLGLANELEFPDGSFQRIYCLELIEHLEQEQAADLLRTLRRLLAPTGRLLVTTPNYLSLWPILELLIDLSHLSPRLRGDQHVTKFRLGRLKRMLAGASLRVARCGRFCGMAPLASLLGWRLGEWVDRAEWRLRNPLGNELYAVAGNAP